MVKKISVFIITLVILMGVINPAQAAVYEPNAAYYDVAVQVERVQEG